MPDDDLTPVQRSVLLILMAEAQEVPNAYLTNDRKLGLRRKRREELEARRMIKVRSEKRRLYLEITDRGLGWCREQYKRGVPTGAGHGGAAAYALLAGIQRYLDRSDLILPDLFSRATPEPAEPPTAAKSMVPGEIEARIRKSYLELAGGPGAWVTLANLRPLLGELARADVDRVLAEMNRTPAVSIVPESNQKVLSDRDRAAAVRIGNQDKHLISIGRS